MLFAKKMIMGLLLANCLASNFVISSDRELNEVEIEDAILTGVYPDWYIEKLEWNKFKKNFYDQIAHKKKIAHRKKIYDQTVHIYFKDDNEIKPLDRERLNLLVDIIISSMPYFDKYWSLDQLYWLKPSPSANTLNTIKHIMSLMSFYNENEPELDLGAVNPDAESLLLQENKGISEEDPGVSYPAIYLRSLQENKGTSEEGSGVSYPAISIN